jgi:hypothetical protein
LAVEPANGIELVRNLPYIFVFCSVPLKVTAAALPDSGHVDRPFQIVA